MTLRVNPSTAMIFTVSPWLIGVVLLAAQFSPSMKTLPPFESIGVRALTTFPSIVSRPTFTGRRCARRPLPTMNRKNPEVRITLGMM
jgi:hypothetical protein